MKPIYLARLRKERGLSQYQMADLLGISRSRYSLYEIGMRRIPVELALRIADILRVPVEALYRNHDRATV